MGMNILTGAFKIDYFGRPECEIANTINSFNVDCVIMILYEMII